MPLDEWLGPVPGLLAEDGVDVDALEFRFRAEPDEYACNWKVAVENFLECYHCQTAHPTLARAMDVSRERYLLETRRWSSTQFGPPRNGGGGIYDTAGEIGRGQFHFLFPGTVINTMPGRANFNIGPVLPRGPERTFRFLDYYFAPAVEQDWLDDFMVLDAAVGAEDRVLVERLQRGLRSGGLTYGVLLPESEKLIVHFQDLVRAALA
jgi:choline monooxygenase